MNDTAQLAECRIVGTLHGSECINVFHLDTPLAVNDSDPNAMLLVLAAAMLDCAIQTLLPAVTQNYRLVHVDAKRLYPDKSDPVIATAPVDSIGQLGPTSVSFAASLANIRTGGGGRQGRGKKFFPPPGEAQVADSVMDEPTLELLTAFLSCLAGKFLGANKTTDWRLGVLSTTHLKTLGGSYPNSFRIATQLSPTATLAVMRSRKVGKGA